MWVRGLGEWPKMSLSFFPKIDRWRLLEAFLQAIILPLETLYFIVTNDWTQSMLRVLAEELGRAETEAVQCRPERAIALGPSGGEWAWCVEAAARPPGLLTTMGALGPCSLRTETGGYAIWLLRCFLFGRRKIVLLFVFYCLLFHFFVY
ncbi:Protein of unknown function [Gryllus bimaculatus]|nr:Protein of unknown function [Gryllus bimaculatus]